MASYFEKIAAALGGECEGSEDSSSVVTARVGSGDLFLFGERLEISGVLWDADLSLRWESAQQDVRSLPATQELLKLWKLPAEKLRIQLSGEGLMLLITARQARLVEAEQLADWVRSLAELAEPHVYHSHTGCCLCGQSSAKLVHRTQLRGRYCKECLIDQISLTKALEKLDPPEQAEPELAMGELPNFDASRFAAQFLSNPVLYRIKLVLWVLLGQAVLLAGSLLAAAVLASLLFILYLLATGGLSYVAVAAAKLVVLTGGKLLILFVGVLGALLSSVAAFFRFPTMGKLPGLELTPRQAPEFFAWLKPIAQRLKAPLPDRLLLVSEMTAAVMEQRRGLFYRRYLMVGIATLESLSLAELESVVAHELAHLRHGDTASLWTYRTAESWRELGARFQQEPGLSVFSSFARWYIPQFLVRARLICRHQELQADRRAAEVCGGAEALLKFEAVQRLRADTLAQSCRRVLADGRAESFDIIDDLLAEVRRASLARVHEALEEGLVEPTHWLSSHPSLLERLDNLGYPLKDLFDFRLELKRCGPDLFADYASIRERVTAKDNERLRLLLRRGALSYPGLRLRQDRLTALLDGPMLADERRLALALGAEELCLPEQQEESCRALLDSSHKDLRDFAVHQLVSRLLADDRPEEALALMGEDEVLSRYLVQRRLKNWDACKELLDRLEAAEPPQEPRESTRVRRRLLEAAVRA